MTELKERFSMTDEIGTRDLWGEARRRAAAPEAPPRAIDWPPAWGHRLAAAAVALTVCVAASVFAWDLSHPDAEPMPPPAVSDPIDLAAQLPPGWSELPPPPKVQSDSASAWTGSELLVWGGGGNDYVVDDGFAFDAESRVWRPIPDGPLSPRSDAASAWTGTELLIWGGYNGDCCARSDMFLADGATYDPRSGRWEEIAEAPLNERAPFSVWTGQELIVWGSRDRTVRYRDGAAFDPSTDTWRAIADGPIHVTDGSAVWTGNEMIVFGASLDGNNRSDTPTSIGAAYDPGSNTWRELPPSDLSPQAQTAAWQGTGEMIAWDYEHATAAYDPATNAWRRLVDVPLRFYECYPRSVAIEGSVLGDFCGSMAVYVASEDRWHDVSLSGLAGWALEPIPAGNAFLVIGHSSELSETPGRTYDTRMLAYVPNGSFTCAGTAGVDPLDPADARSVAKRFMLLRIHDAENDLARLLTPSGRNAFANIDSDLRPLRGDYIISEVAFVDGPLAISPGGPEGAYEIGVRMTTSPDEETFAETLFLAPGQNLEGEDCPLLVQGGRSGLSGP